MAEPIKWKSKIILVKPETSYGVDPTPTGAANAVLMTDVQLQPMEGDDVSRALDLPYLGAQEAIPTGLRCVLTGSVELVGGAAAGTAPAWGPLLRACAVAEVVTAGTKVEYTPISDNHESVAIYFQIGTAGSRHIILGARGTCVITLNAQGIPVMRFTLTGLYATPADAARPTPDLTSWQAPQVASKTNTPTFTIGGTAFVARQIEFDLGIAVVPRLLIGAERIVVTDRVEQLTCTVEAVAYATYNPFSIAEARTKQAIALTHGTAVGKRVALSVPIAQQKRPSGFSNQDNALEWPLGFVALPSAGNDQWKITVN